MPFHPNPDTKSCLLRRSFVALAFKTAQVGALSFCYNLDYRVIDEVGKQIVLLNLYVFIKIQ